MTRNERWALASMILIAMAGIISGYTLLGKVATAAPLLTLFFAGVATGASLSLFLQKRRVRTENKKSPANEI